MILQALTQHYETLVNQGKVSKQGWCRAKVSYALNIARDGSLSRITSLKPEESIREKTVWAQLIEVPEMVTRSSGISANFLCDNSKYLLGIDANGTDKRTQKCFESARKKHLHVLDSVNHEAAKAIINFFEKWEPEKAKEHPDIARKWDDITAGANLIFYVGEEYAQDIQEIRRAWEQSLEVEKDGAIEGICLVTGKKTEISRIHNLIRGVQGAQSSGAALVSFNAPSFESYGKEQSYNAPVGKYAAFAYTTALNYLLSQRNHVVTLGDITIVFWAAEGEEIYQKIFLNLLESEEDSQEIIKRIFTNLKTGQAVDIEGGLLNLNEQFYILGLAPNAARLSVRFFYQDSFKNILSNLQMHYKRMEIVRPAWDNWEYLDVWHILMETVNQKSKDKKPHSNMAASVLEAILSNKRYPESLYSNTLIRIRAEQGKITRGRAAIVKAHLIRNYENHWIKEETFVGLNEACDNAAYILGREFAVLEAIQEEANPGINATIKDRYFNSACATPASVFPILLKLKNSHIRKIENKIKVYFEKMLTELQGKIAVVEGQMTAYPRRLSLEEQGMFILGYYHQNQKRFEKKEKKEEK